MKPRFEIRSPLSPAEWQTVRELLTAYWNEFEDKTCFTSFEEEMTNIENLYARPDKAKLIAVDKEKEAIAGCVGLRGIAPGVAEMKRLYVPPAFRGHHLGKDLAIAIMDKARDMGFNTMVLDTMVEMKAAQGLYRQLGFDVIPPYSDQGSRNVICFGTSLLA